MSRIYLPNGGMVLLQVMPLHGRKPRSLRPYARVTSWLAQAGCELAWGRTRREAVSELLRKLNASLTRPLPDNIMEFRR